MVTRLESVIKVEGHALAYAASWLAASAPVVFLIAATAATLLAPGYSSISSTISELGTSDRPHPWIINTGFVSYGVMVQGLGPGLHRLANSSAVGSLYWSLVIVYGAGGVLAGLFVTGGGGEYLLGATAGDIHGIAAGGTLSAISVLMLLSAAPGLAWSSSSAYRLASLFLALMTLGAAVTFQILPDDASWRGFIQRTFFVTTMAWVFITSTHVRIHLPRN